MYRVSMVIRIIYGARQDGNMEDRCVKETGSVDKQTEDRLGEGIKPRLERDKCIKEMVNKSILDYPKCTFENNSSKSNEIILDNLLADYTRKYGNLFKEARSRVGQVRKRTDLWHGHVLASRDKELFPEGSFAGNVQTLMKKDLNRLGAGGNGEIVEAFYQRKHLVIKQTLLRELELSVVPKLEHKNLLPWFAIISGEKSERRPGQVSCYQIMQKMTEDLSASIRTIGGSIHDHILSLQQDNVPKAVVSQQAGLMRRNTSGVFRNVLEGLEYLHEQGLVHRDIKASNILLKKPESCAHTSIFTCDCTPHWEVKVADFDSIGQAFVLRERAAMRGKKKLKSGCRPFLKVSATGTSGYRAPEIFEEFTTSNLHDPQYFGPASDIWALGGVGIHMVMGFCTPRKQYQFGLMMLAHRGMLKGEERDDIISRTLGLHHIREGFPGEKWKDMINFVSRPLQIDWHQRPSAKDLLQDPFIQRYNTTPGLDTVVQETATLDTALPRAIEVNTKPQQIENLRNDPLAPYGEQPCEDQSDDRLSDNEGENRTPPADTATSQSCSGQNEDESSDPSVCEEILGSIKTLVNKSILDDPKCTFENNSSKSKEIILDNLLADYTRKYGNLFKEARSRVGQVRKRTDLWHGNVLASRDKELFPEGSFAVNVQKLMKKDLNRLGAGGNGEIVEAFYQRKPLAIKETLLRELELSVVPKLEHKNLLLWFAIISGEKSERRPGQVSCYQIMQKMTEDLSASIRTIGGSIHDHMLTLQQDNVPKAVVSQQAELMRRNTSGVFRNVLEGLEYLHEQGLVHRDIKASNILLKKPESCAHTSIFTCDCTPHWEVKVADFDSIGQAFVLRERAAMRGKKTLKSGCRPFLKVSATGTSGYRAPEFGLMMLAHRGMLQGEERDDIISRTLGLHHIREGFPGEKWKDMINFVSRPLQIDWYQRPSAEDLLQDPFIQRYNTTPGLDTVVNETATLDTAMPRAIEVNIEPQQIGNQFNDPLTPYGEQLCEDQSDDRLSDNEGENRTPPADTATSESCSGQNEDESSDPSVCEEILGRRAGRRCPSGESSQSEDARHGPMNHRPNQQDSGDIPQQEGTREPAGQGAPYSPEGLSG